MPMNTRTHNRNRRRGIAMLLVLTVIATVVVMAFGLTAAMGTSGQMASNVVHREQARAVAASGLNLAVQYIKTHADWRSNWSSGVWVQDANLAGGKCTLSADVGAGASSAVTLTATGTVSGASVTLQAVVTPAATAMARGVIAATSVRVDGWGSRIDSYDSSKGGYGGTNVGSAATVSTNATSSQVVQVTDFGVVKGSVAIGPGGNTSTAIYKDSVSTITGARTTLSTAQPMVAPAAPTNLGPSIGNLKFSGSGTDVISGNLHLNSLEIKHSARVQIQGNVTILVEGTVSIHDSSTWLEVLPGASLKLYHKGGLTVWGNADCVVNGANLSRLQFINLGTANVVLDSAVVEGVILSPNAGVLIDDYSQFYGAVMAKSISVTDGSDVHQDVNISSGKDPVLIDSTSTYKVRPVEKF